MNADESLKVLNEIIYTADIRGLSLNSLIEWMKAEDTIIVGGNIHHSLNAACDFYEIGRSYLYRCARETDTPVISLLKSKVEQNYDRPVTVSLNDKVIKNLSPLPRELVIEFVKTVNKQGLSLDSLLTWLKDENTIIVAGKIHHSFEKACKYYNVDSAYLYKRSRETGINVTALLDEKVKSNKVRKHSVTYKGEPYPNFSALCRAHDLDPIVVQSYVDNKKVSHLEAFEYALKNGFGQRKYNRTGKKEVVNGVPYLNRKAVYDAYEITSRATLKYMSVNECSFEEAVIAVANQRK